MTLLSLGGCRLIIYGAIGEQSIEKLKLEMIGQKADPNIPSGLINVGVSLP